MMAYEYNAEGQNTRTTYPDASYTETAYDGPRVVSQCSRTDNTTAYAYDILGRRVAVTNSLGRVTAFTFDAVGNQLSIIDPMTNTTSFYYDDMNRLTITVRPDGLASTNSGHTLEGSRLDNRFR